MADILHGANAPMSNLPLYSREHNQEIVKLCSEIPGTVDVDPCIVVFDSAAPSNMTWTAPSGYGRDFQLTGNASGTVEFGGFVLDEQCTRVLQYPYIVCVLNQGALSKSLTLYAGSAMLGERISLPCPHNSGCLASLPLLYVAQTHRVSFNLISRPQLFFDSIPHMSVLFIYRMCRDSSLCCIASQCSARVS